jgi:MPBQ/MSBQ methyltransferase
MKFQCLLKSLVLTGFCATCAFSFTLETRIRPIDAGRENLNRYQDFQWQTKSSCSTFSPLHRIPRRRSTSIQLAIPGALNPIFVANPLVLKAATLLLSMVIAATGFVKIVLDTPSRTYGDTTVGEEYDTWADDGILEYYWGEHIHLGYYSKDEMKKGYLRKNFIQAKYDFIDEMMKFGDIDAADYGNTDVKVLDVGCGFGGTSRYLAKKLGNRSLVTGITLSPKQVERATTLASEQGVSANTKFVVMNALDMEFEDNSFDIVWACESGEHMPDKKLYIDEMMRVLKPGGKFVMACWSQRDDTVVPFDKRDRRDLNYLYEEWSHPYFISVNDWTKLIQDTGSMISVRNNNWVNETIASWRHSIWVGVFDPFGWITKVNKYMRIFRDAYCLERMHRAFKRGLMEYGMFAAVKKN